MFTAASWHGLSIRVVADKHEGAHMRRREFIGIVAAGLAARWPLLASDSPTPRRRENFNSGWLFRRQAHGGGALGSFDRNSLLGSEVEPEFLQATQAAYSDSTWEQIFLPHTWNAHDASDEIAGYFRGIGWYRKHFVLGEELRGKRISLEFEGVNQVSEFWLNGSRLGEHKGGYTSFEFDVTELAQFGSAGNVLTVKVNNLYDPNIAPTIKTDLTFYGGIYRDVWLRVTEPIYLSTVYWRTPHVSESSAYVDVYAAVGNPDRRTGSFRILVEVLDAGGKVVGSVSSPVDAMVINQRELTTRRIRVSNPRLWSPDSPNLYCLRASLLEGDRVWDSLETPLGLRWFGFDADKGFFLNGKRLQLQGTTWHQSYPGMGDALPNSRHYADMLGIREMGCNFFRTSHYPHDPAVIEACDRLGILVLEELFVGEEVENTPAYFEIQAQTAKEMIERDRNNPSVILWGLSGEVDDPEKSVEVVRRILQRYRELDPSRLVTMHDPRAEGVKEVLDVVGLFGTFEQDDRDHRKYLSRKYLIEEYSAAEIGRGVYGMGPGSEDRGCISHERFLSEVNLRPWIAGSVLWHQLDYDGEEYDSVIPHVLSFGMADSWRIPKDVYYFYQSQWSRKQMVHICGHWTWPGDEGKKKSVKVYSNCEQVELKLNGRSMGMKEDGKHEGLVHPPRVWDLPYEVGTLEAIGRSGPQTIVDTRKTAGPPAGIVLRSDVDHIASGDRESLAYITALVVDKDGTVVPNAYNTISFTWYGPGELLPQTWAGYPTGLTWKAVAGMTVVALRATDRVGRCRVTAYSPGLALGRVETAVSAKGKRDEMEYRSGADVYK
jgi:beta-galactosidase